MSNSTSTEQSHARPLKSSPSRLRADRERSEAAALAEIDAARRARLEKSKRLRELRLAEEENEAQQAADKPAPARRTKKKAATKRAR